MTYIGFSTAQNFKKYTLTDFELVKKDLINHFSIRKGEKLMQPNFGSVIWDMMFEPLDESTQQVITEDINRIAASDPRLIVGQVAITEQEYGLLIEITVAYVPTNQQDMLSLSFNRNSKTLTTN